MAYRFRMLFVLLAFAVLGAPAAKAQGPPPVEVSNITVSERGDQQGVLDIHYDLDEPEGAHCDIQVRFSTDGGVSFPYLARHVSGDVGSGVPPGAGRHIVWRAIDQFAGKNIGNAVVRVIATQTRTFDGMEFVWIPPGTYMRGSPDGEGSSNERPQHEVTLTQGFWMGKYPVTKAQWEIVMDTIPWLDSNGSPRNEVSLDPDSPVQYVNWDHAMSFIHALNDQGGPLFRLPTEAEWEYAARAGTTTRFHFGDDPFGTELPHYAWYNVNSPNYPPRVGQKPPNPWGLYDMHGLIWEWLHDWYGSYTSDPQTDPMGPNSGTTRALRGGAYHNGMGNLRSAGRGAREPSTTSSYVLVGYGFRLVRSGG